MSADVCTAGQGVAPFLTLYTPTYRRPRQLARCLDSVREQTAVAAVEQLVIPDHLGIGVGGMFARVQAYVGAVHGRYVHVLCDDDVLASPTVVAEVQAFAEAYGHPPVILVGAEKGGRRWPAGEPWPPRCGLIDLGCVITRTDVWKQHARDYAASYEGDYWFMRALYEAGHPAVFCNLLFSVGAVSHGVPEAVAV
jgi:hypothetical protein